MCWWLYNCEYTENRWIVHIKFWIVCYMSEISIKKSYWLPSLPLVPTLTLLFIEHLVPILQMRKLRPQEVIKLSRIINSQEMAELEIQVVWCSPNSAGKEEDHEHRTVCTHVVCTLSKAFRKHFLIYSPQHPERKVLGSQFKKRGPGGSGWLSNLLKHACVKREKVEIPVQGCFSSGVSSLPCSDLSLSLALNELIINTGPGGASGNIRPDHSCLKGQIQAGVHMVFKCLTPPKPQLCSLDEVFNVRKMGDGSECAVRVG